MISRATHEGSDEPAKIYDVTTLALSFREVAVDIVRGEKTEFLSRWYQSEKGDADLSIWWDGEKRVVKQQLCLYGQVVEWTPIHGTRTGLVVEHENETDETSDIINYDARLQRPSVNQAIALVREITALIEADRALVVYNFRESPKLHKNARERALRAWALANGEDLLSPARPSFWKRLGHWMFGPGK